MMFQRMLLASAATLALAGCGLGLELGGSGDTIEDFERLSGFEVPESAEILGIDGERGIDVYYSVVLEMPADDLDTMLVDAEFSTALEPIETEMAISRGADPDWLADGEARAAQDDTESPSGSQVFRDVTVIGDDPARVIVAAYTT